MSRYLIYFFCLWLGNSLFHAQNEATRWRFNTNAGLDFLTSPPTPTVGGPVISNLCGMSIADAAGNLLFYSNGFEIYDAQGGVMANGNAVGGLYAPQNSIALKQPGVANLYYVFLNSNVNGGLKFAVVDMGLAGGSGSVTIKNQTLMVPGGSGKLAAARHCNGVDSWIMTQRLGTNEFAAFLLTSAGINTVPVVSAVGFTSQTNYGGQLKFSPDGRKLAVVHGFYGKELFDFDSSTGILSNGINLQNENGASCEFSADGSKLYAAGGDFNRIIYQWDACGATASDVTNSMDTAGVCTATSYAILYMQLGPDEKIYTNHGGQVPALGVINSPEQSGINCNYNDLGQPLSPGSSGGGPPGFESHLLRAKFNYTAANSCASATFNVPSPGCKTNGVYSWNFGDPASGTANTSTLNNPVHNFSSGGTYTVKLASSFNSSCAPDTLIRIITIASSPSITLSGKLNFCKNETSVITASGASTYTWNNGSNSNSIAVNNSSPLVYTVSATFSNNCTSSRVFSVSLLNCTGLNEITDQPIKVYPNPIGEALFIETEHPVKILLYDALGRIVLQKNLSQGKQSINTEYFATGIYFLRMEKENEVQVLRLVKE